MSPPRSKQLIKINSLTQAALIRLLLDGTRDCRELAEETGLHYVTVLRYCRELHRAGALHIAEWRQDEADRWTVKVYKIGVAKDKRRPKPLTHNERAERYREKQRKLKMDAVLSGAAIAEQAANGRIRVTPIPLSSMTDYVAADRYTGVV